MSETTEYFIIGAIMFAMYVLIRLLWEGVGWIEYRKYILQEKRWQEEGPPTAFIDTAALAESIQHAREHLYEVAHEHRPDFKKPLMIEEKRKEISQLAYFRHLEEHEPEPQEAHDGTGLVMI